MDLAACKLAPPEKEDTQIVKPPPCPKLPKHLIKKPEVPDKSLSTPIDQMPRPFWPVDRSCIPPPPKLPYIVPPVPKLGAKPAEKQSGVKRQSTHNID